MPSFDVALRAGASGAIVALIGALIAGRLRRRDVRVAYTRKVFHFVVFTAAAGVHLAWGPPGAVAYGTVLAAVVLFAVARGEGNLLYDVMAREKDAPHQTLFILVPMITTAVGGLAAAWITGPFAVVGYLAAGWGDAAGEPAGARFGKHPYSVPSLAGVHATRTLEGSAAVWIFATLGSAVALGAVGGIPWWGAPMCGTVAAIVEAGSNHGLDNLTVQLVPSLVAWTVFG
ncbi:MAG: hypothetical protein AAF389_08340 [Gemmatimonadota bacterium]